MRLVQNVHVVPINTEGGTRLCGANDGPYLVRLLADTAQTFLERAWNIRTVGSICSECLAAWDIRPTQREVSNGKTDKG